MKSEVQDLVNKITVGTEFFTAQHLDATIAGIDREGTDVSEQQQQQHEFLTLCCSPLLPLVSGQGLRMRPR